ncbi:VanZ family protein [Salinibius halmophilus]|uniref:VanZ family protein n=1 Tax=Salinibius halmophilus TaxID=1853216 RepID=UPI000E6645E1|nr:VanZ family protein [Salinibius halmophilus]
MVISKKTIFLGLALAAITPLFFLGGPHWHSPDVYRAVWNQGHVFFFFFFSWFIAQFWPLRRDWWQYLLLLLAVSLAIETVQIAFSRSFSLMDIVNNLLGAAFYLVWSRPMWQRLVVMLPLLWQWGDIGLHGLAYYQQVQRFPLLADFSTSGQLRQWRGPITQTPEQLGQISFSTDTFSTVMLDDMPRDWRGYQTLVMKMVNPSDEALSVVLRINDIQHIYVDQEETDRYRHRFEVPPGESSINIDLLTVKNAPRDRSMNMGEIQAVMLFTTALPEPRTLLIDKLFLD